MRDRFILFILLIVCGVSHAQNKRIDSLLKALPTLKSDTSKALTLVQLALAYSETGEIHMATIRSDEALTLSERIKFKKGEGLAYYSFGRLNQYRGDHVRALEFQYKALSILESLRDSLNVGWVLLNIGITECAQMKYSDAKGHNLAALSYFENIGFKQGVAYCALNLSIVYYSTCQYEIALEFAKKSEKICREIGDFQGLGYTYTSYGNIYKRLGQYEKSLKYYYECIEIKKGYGDKIGIALCYADVGYVHLLLGDSKKARNDFNIALTQAKKVDAKDVLVSAYLGMALTDSAEGDFKNAFLNQKLYSLYKDSVLREENGKRSFQLQSMYEHEKKDKEIKLLQKEKDAEKMLNEGENKTLIIILISVVMGLITVGVFSVFLYKRVDQVQRQRNIISKQKERSDEQHKNIRDSIVYARRIQRALLTSDEYIKAHLNLEFFIYYQPKDIVSGDFYWAVQHNRKFYLVTADCTGHGVPGAFMSLLNISFLNEIIVEKNITSPSAILNEQRKQIIKALNPKGNENSQDGMDCVLCEFDIDNVTLNFAAANSSLWLVRENKLTEYKGDKMPVGKHMEHNKDFTDHSLLLEHGDVIYTFTDGIADQFGGPEGKKFKYRQLSDLLLSIHHLPMAEQREVIQKKVNEWKGNKDQTDDILIIAVKI